MNKKETEYRTKVNIKKKVKTKEIKINGRSYSIVPAVNFEDKDCLGFICFKTKQIFIKEKDDDFNRLKFLKDRVLWHEIAHAVLHEVSENKELKSNESKESKEIYNSLNNRELFVDILGEVLSKTFKFKNNRPKKRKRKGE